MSAIGDIRQAILGCNPFDGFDYKQYANDQTGGESYPIVEEIISHVKPQLIIEVGSWKGKSAINMVKIALATGLTDFSIICVDTWLGSDVVHQLTHVNDDVWGLRGMRNRGYPTMYFQFLANVCHAGVQDYIIPFPNTSSTAASFLKRHSNIIADVIYIDACHDEDECYLDIVHYWDLLCPGGVMFGDDFDAMWFGVIAAVNRFAKEHKLRLMVAPGNKWILQKPV